ncbi:YciI family protein [Acidipila sp. EB88]|uniref:YciI family protein n=1 Tax=Acidipila sp. EB88 TaxID=2305226 RepID=UPI000F5DC23E|nr:YciI family protein [Acidipila sp. EB88]
MPEEILPTDQTGPTPDSRPANIPRNLKPYFLCFLVKGPKWDEPEGAETLMPAQLAFLRDQIEWRRYKLAGPVTAAGDIVGFSILEAADAAAALALANQDPAVLAGRVNAQILPAILPSLDTLKIEFPTRR